MFKPVEKEVYRIIDANFNRTKEGLRVCEDVCRFFHNKKKETRQYKDVRHQLTRIISRFPIAGIIKTRDIQGDVGRQSSSIELQRKSVDDIFYANSQRVKESLRVLEEFAKLMDGKSAESIKKIRYKAYALEKKVVGRS